MRIHKRIKLPNFTDAVTFCSHAIACNCRYLVRESRFRILIFMRTFAKFQQITFLKFGSVPPLCFVRIRLSGDSYTTYKQSKFETYRQTSTRVEGPPANVYFCIRCGAVSSKAKSPWVRVRLSSSRSDYRRSALKRPWSVWPHTLANLKCKSRVSLSTLWSVMLNI